MRSDPLETVVPWGQYAGETLRQTIQTKYGREWVWLTYERMKAEEPLHQFTEALGRAAEAAREVNHA